MNIYLLEQDVNDGYDTYDSAVVIAKDEEEARRIEVGKTEIWGSWAKPEYVKVTYLGEFKGKLEDIVSNIICASFNAG